MSTQLADYIANETERFFGLREIERSPSLPFTWLPLLLSIVSASFLAIFFPFCTRCQALVPSVLALLVPSADCYFFLLLLLYQHRTPQVWGESCVKSRFFQEGVIFEGRPHTKAEIYDSMELTYKSAGNLNLLQG